MISSPLADALTVSQTFGTVAADFLRPDALPVVANPGIQKGRAD